MKCVVCKTCKKPSAAPVTGSPRQSNLGGEVFSDNRGKLVSDEFNICKNFNIKILTTPTESP